IVVQLLHIFAVIALVIGETEQPLLQPVVAAIPQGQPQTPIEILVAEAGQAVFAPPVGAGMRVLEREGAPAIAIGAIVFAHRAPLTLA
ncbi:hypothetical protein RF55_17832, partial [Lasius niger]